MWESQGNQYNYHTLLKINIDFLYELKEKIAIKRQALWKIFPH